MATVLERRGRASARETSALENRLRGTLAGSVAFDAASRGRYATDASHYQVMPRGVAAPRDEDDLEAALTIAREDGTPVLMRGGGTSQCGQTVNDALVLDVSRHMNGIVDLDVEDRRCTVRPGIVLDELNRALKPHGLWFPVDVSTASRATIGGMTGNNSCGARSLRYGTMRDNVVSIDAVMASGERRRFGEAEADANDPLVRDLLALGAREADEVARRFPDVPRRVGGYNLDALAPPDGGRTNLAHLLVGSEGTLAASTAIELKLSPLPGPAVLGVCHFPTFRAAMEAAQHLVALTPTSVELVDSTMIGLARDIPAFRETLERFVVGEPAALLLVEFAEDYVENARRLEALADVMSDIGQPGGMVPVADAGLRGAIGELRRSGLNIMMSMRDARKPVSFVEDCAVPLPDLADYTERLSEVFERHGTRGTWYAHASVGCLHVRPVLNLRLRKDAKAMRSIAEEAFALVREYKGSHSGEHGDGIVRSEFHEPMFGSRLVRAFEEVKDRFDPDGRLNPGRVVRPPRMDDASLFRFGGSYAHAGEHEARMDWTGWAGGAGEGDPSPHTGAFLGAVEMCNNNGACRKLAGGAMCPSYRVTREERDTTRGRANTLRLALTGQLGPDAFASDEVAEALSLCVSCKACKRECPTGVDMAAMKIEVQAERVARHGLSARDRLIAYLPRYAALARRGRLAFALRDVVPGVGAITEKLLGFASGRTLPRFAADPFRNEEGRVAPQGSGIEASGSIGSRDAREEPQSDERPLPTIPEGSGADAPTAGPPGLAPNRPQEAGGADAVVLFADTFNRWLEPENLRAAVRVLGACGTGVEVAAPEDGGRPLCCGRTFLAAGLVVEARTEARRTAEALAPHVAAGRAIVGLEPSCLLTLRDEFAKLLPDHDTDALAARSLMLEEYLAQRADAGEAIPAFKDSQSVVHLHGHCHQKAFGVMPAVERALRLVPGMEVRPIESSCCGMAGAFGYAAETADASRAMGELSLLPAVRAAGADEIVVADGTSCRHQIHDGADREALHVARVLDAALDR